MSSISLEISIDNASDAVLRLVKQDLVHGHWAEDEDAPSTIGPGDKVRFRGEGKAILGEPTTGTEGRVFYRIDAPQTSGELYIHWDSALVESPFGNTFNIECPSGWEVTYSGGQGHSAKLRVRLRRTAVRRVPNFDPHGRGFAFSNNWDSKLPAVKLGFILKTLFSNDACIGKANSIVATSLLTVATGGVAPIAVAAMSEDFGPTLTNCSMGLCGGMTFTVMDYYYAHLLPPTLTASPTSPDDPLFQYVRQRQLDSFDFKGQGCRFLVYTLPVYPHGDEGVFQQVLGIWKGRSWVTYREAWPQIQSDIDAGKLSPVGLIHSATGNLAINHQVLAYGYQRSGQDVTLYILDPNEIHSVVTFDFNVTSTQGGVHVVRKVDGVPNPGGTPEEPHRVYCFFRMNNYVSQTPPSGRRFNSLRESLLASGDQAGEPSRSTRHALAGRTSVLEWIRSL